MKRAPKADDVPLDVGAHVDRFRVRRLVGSGAMALVYEATDTQSGDRIALKVLRATLAKDAEVARRFLAEGRTAAVIDSPHVARIYGAGVDPNSRLHWIAMELLFGQDLEVILSERKRLPFELAVGYVVQACEGIAEAHRHGVVHRDLKPSNFFLAARADGTETLKILDFGISKASKALAGDRSGMTGTGEVLGTPAYMSPEQLRSSRDVDVRTDIWSLGVVLFELITGELPFDAPDFGQLCLAILMSEPRPIAELVPEIPVALDDIVARCLARAPEDRYRDVPRLSRALWPYAPREVRERTEQMNALFFTDERPALGVGPTESTADESPPETRPADSARFGRYLIVTDLGGGGMGTVSLATREDRPAELVVLKTIAPAHGDDPHFETMLRDEARIAGRLVHPNVVRTFEAGEAAGQYYIAMEYVAGQSLRAVLSQLRKRDRGLPVAMAVSILADVLAGLHHAHDLVDDDRRPLEVVHRDVTPHNVLVGYGGQVRIIDFGIAKAVGQRALTAKGVIKGKLAYIPPEQATARHVDRRADVFAVGVMLYELLTLRRYWADIDNDMAIMVRLAMGHLPDPPSAHVPDVDRDLERIHLRATRANRDERYPTAAAMERDLRAWLAAHGRPTPAEVGALVTDAFADERQRLRAIIEAKLARRLARQ